MFMTANPLEEALEKAMRRVLNDRRIFQMRIELIGQAGWTKLRDALSQGNGATALQVIGAAKDDLARKINTEGDQRKRQDLDNARKLLEGLEANIKQGSYAANRVFELMDQFGPVECKLSRDVLQDLGVVIERYDRTTVDQFFLYKIQEGPGYQRQPLTALLEIVRELHVQGVGPLKIAFFVRKIRALDQLVEVLR